jgi:hypothetical protein
MDVTLGFSGAAALLPCVTRSQALSNSLQSDKALSRRA